MGKEQFLHGLKDNLILWDVEQLFHKWLTDAEREDLSVLGTESVGRELATKKEKQYVRLVCLKIE